MKVGNDSKESLLHKNCVLKTSSKRGITRVISDRVKSDRVSNYWVRSDQVRSDRVRNDRVRSDQVRNGRWLEMIYLLY